MERDYIHPRFKGTVISSWYSKVKQEKVSFPSPPFLCAVNMSDLLYYFDRVQEGCHPVTLTYFDIQLHQLDSNKTSETHNE